LTLIVGGVNVPTRALSRSGTCCLRLSLSTQNEIITDMCMARWSFKHPPKLGAGDGSGEGRVVVSNGEYNLHPKWHDHLSTLPHVTWENVVVGGVLGTPPKPLITLNFLTIERGRVGRYFLLYLILLLALTTDMCPPP